MSALAARIRAVLELDPGAPAIEFGDTWYSWRDVARAADEVDAALGTLGAGAGAPVGVLLANRPAAVGFLLGVLRADACAVTLNPHLGAERVTRDVDDHDLALVAGAAIDVDHAGVTGTGHAALSLTELGAPASLTLPTGGRPPAARPLAGVAVRMLTSGTTGPPKRVDLSYATLERVMVGAKHYETNARSDLALREGVVIVNAPLVHLSGVFRVLQAVLDGRRIALLERFTVGAWADAVRRHHPKTVSLVPTALRMVLESDVEDDLLAEVKSVVSGTAPLDPEVADAFTARFGVPVLTSYAATEFGGGVAGWNLGDHRAFGAAKRGSVGRAHPGCELRVVDPDTFMPRPPGEVGLLEVQAAQLPDDGWIRTTDLARIDDDGFLWIVGRADQTILRGGFKVQPDVVRSALERHPEVRGAAVFGVDDERLGQVPVAAVELRAGSHTDSDDLLAHLRPFLAPYELPARIVIVDELPRTPSAKVDLAAARHLVSDPADA
ncbi:MAG TPA: fatty acid--CoA ligase family protein [Acidimicrobiia bacterium]|nr:fatty acid--CoA ligase family protein [Acidimicrobiia bacterium]